MKSYTDIEQSKKLAEILPLESADMCYPYDRHLNKMYGDIPYVMGYKRFNEDTDFPCWSLTALYGILPNNEKESTILSRGGWKIEPYEYVDNWWCEYEDDSHTKDFTVSADNPVGACCKMILKLHEQKIL